MAKTATPWGAAELVEELVVRQQAGEKRFASIVQLLETPGGERLVRFAYSTDGTARRGPVTLRERGLDERGEHEGAVRGAEQRVDRVLGMRHQAEHVAPLVADAGDVGNRPVARLAVAHDNLTIRFELSHDLRRRIPPSVTVLDGNDDALAHRAARRERDVVSLDDERDVAAHEAQRFVLEERPGQEAGLAEDLEAVADPEHEPPGVGELAHGGGCG